MSIVIRKTNFNGQKKPFFHNHTDDGTLNHENTKLHSHFVSDISGGSKHAESDHHLEGSSTHEHFFKPNHLKVAVIQGGLLTSTALNMIVIPSLFYKFGKEE